MLRTENPEFSFPPGRYEVMLDGQAYDFVIAGEVTDSAQIAWKGSSRSAGWTSTSANRCCRGVARLCTKSLI
jgi:hypothetical protein